MSHFFAGALLCAASCWANAAQPETETFIIHNGRSGHVATVMIPVGAVSNFSANAAEALVGSDPQVESMRLSGDVRIQVIGQRQPITITADNVLLELTANEKGTPAQLALPQQAGTSIRSRSSRSVHGGRDAQTFLGNVSFTVDTVAGAMQIRADNVEHRTGAGPGV